MSNPELFEKILHVHDQVISTLKALQIPPYPSNYKKYFDELIFKSIETIHHNDYMDETHKDDHCGKCKYLDIAQRSVTTFMESHSDISMVAQLQHQYLNHASSHGGERCSETIHHLSHLGDDMSHELKKAQLKIDELTNDLKKAVSETLVDPLTQIANRKKFIEDLEKLIHAGSSKTLPSVLLMIDADNFKLLNDTYGHVAGDKVLYFMAQTIKSIIRHGDMAYRYGGEEFAVVLNRCDHNQAFVIADKIRANIEQSNLIYGGKTIHVTVSIGVTIHRMGDTYDEFVSRADDALYRAKNGRKNCTVVFD